MAKASKPAAKKRSGAAGRKTPAKPAAKPEAAKKSTVSKASTAAGSSKAAPKAASSAVSPSAIKKELEASAKPTPPVAKEAPSTFAVKEDATKSEPQTAKPAAYKPTVAPAPAKQRSIFWPLVVVGVIAVVLGFLASELDVFGNRSQTDDLRATLTEQADRISALESVEPPKVPEVTFPELDTLSGQVDQLASQLAALDARLTVVEKQPITGGTSQAAVAAYERELEALQASVAAQRAEIEGLLDNALSVEEATAQAARTAKLQGALTEITTAINSGQPFSTALNTLTENGVDNVPAALSDTAESGVQTLNALQTRFPDAARGVLKAVRASGAEESEGGVGGFLRRQLGARSVTPREGDDPDAVLSRAEAAVREGRLDDALSEMETLPRSAKDEMQSWQVDASARQAALTATQDLSQSLTAN